MSAGLLALLVLYASLKQYMPAQTALAAVGEETVIELKIIQAFPDEPLMPMVARCESGVKNLQEPNDSSDVGALQINLNAHGKELKRLGLDPHDVDDNIAFARILYDEAKAKTGDGLQPWRASRACWSRK